MDRGDVATLGATLLALALFSLVLLLFILAGRGCV
jgi:hypothetical protein